MHPIGFIGNGENINFELFQATVFFVVVVVVGFWSWLADKLSFHP